MGRGDLIEEYGRHTGHAELIHEAVDRLAGQDVSLPTCAPSSLPRQRLVRLTRT